MSYLFSKKKNLTLNMAYPLIYNREQWAYLYIDWFVIIVQ